MYVRVEFDYQRQFIQIDNIDELTFHQFVKMGELFKRIFTELKLTGYYHKCF